MLSMTALLRRIHRILAKENARKSIQVADMSSPTPAVADVTVIRAPFDFKPLERAETAPATPAPRWKRRLSTRKSDASTARAARDKAAQSHYVLRRSTVIFPEMSDEKWEAQVYAHANRSLHSLPVATVHFAAQVIDIPPPKAMTSDPAPMPLHNRTRSISNRPRRKPVPSLYALDPDAAPMLIPLPPSPALSACVELNDSELAELAV